MYAADSLLRRLLIAFHRQFADCRGDLSAITYSMAIEMVANH